MHHVCKHCCMLMMKKVWRNKALSDYLNSNDKKKSWYTNSSLVLGLPQYFHESAKYSKNIKLQKNSTKSQKQTVLLQYLLSREKLLFWGYLKIYLQLNVPISTRDCWTLTGIKKYLKIYLQLNVPISTHHCCTLTGIKK